jgi:hypothetical protein
MILPNVVAINFHDITGYYRLFYIWEVLYFTEGSQGVGLLPRKGNKCITVTQEVQAEIKRRAKETNRTISEYIEYLLAQEKARKRAK